MKVLLSAAMRPKFNSLFSIFHFSIHNFSNKKVNYDNYSTIQECSKEQSVAYVNKGVTWSVFY